MASPALGRIVVIDDNREIADLLGALCQELGYQAFVAYGGIDGLALIQQRMPHVVFSDIDMPDMNGLDVARRLRGDAALQQPLLIAVTAWPKGDSTRAIETAGFDVHLVKPIRLDEVATLLAGHFNDGA
jgi:CheY-like chemotaxis protein